MLRIGQLAKKTGFTPKTLRYYEQVGLLRPATRSDSGYRLYRDDAVERLGLVHRARGLGIRLADIQRILEISDEGRVPCEHVIAILDRELDRIEAEMQRLQELRGHLSALRARMAVTLESNAVRPGDTCPCFQDGDL
jgi:DNA-binding transcriptional MerR regulator